MKTIHEQKEFNKDIENIKKQKQKTETLPEEHSDSAEFIRELQQQT